MVDFQSTGLHAGVELSKAAARTAGLLGGTPADDDADTDHRAREMREWIGIVRAWAEVATEEATTIERALTLGGAQEEIDAAKRATLAARTHVLANARDTIADAGDALTLLENSIAFLDSITATALLTAVRDTALAHEAEAARLDLRRALVRQATALDDAIDVALFVVAALDPENDGPSVPREQVKAEFARSTRDLPCRAEAEGAQATQTPRPTGPRGNGSGDRCAGE